MKILCVIDNLGAGGAQRQMVTLCQGLAEAGIKVDLFYYHDISFFKKDLVHNNIKLLFHKKTDKIGIGVILALNKIIRRGEYDIVLSFLQTPNLYNILAARLSGRNVIVITSERSKTSFKGVGYLLQKFTHNLSNILVCNSYHEAAAWKTRANYSDKKVRVIYNGLDFNKYYPSTNEYKQYKKGLCIGSVGPSKNGLVVIDALNLYKREDSEFEITWIGQQVKHIPSFANYLALMTKRIEEFSLGSNWTWKLPHHNLLEEFHTHDFLILASTVEGLPNVVGESLASGTPVIISNVLDHPRMVVEGVNGYLFDPKSPESLCNAIRSYYQKDQDRLVVMKQESVNQAKRLFDNKRMVNEYIQLFNELISRN